MGLTTSGLYLDFILPRHPNGMTEEEVFRHFEEELGNEFDEYMQSNLRIFLHLHSLVPTTPEDLSPEGRSHAVIVRDGEKYSIHEVGSHWRQKHTKEVKSHLRWLQITCRDPEFGMRQPKKLALYEKIKGRLEEDSGKTFDELVREQETLREMEWRARAREARKQRGPERDYPF